MNKSRVRWGWCIGVAVAWTASRAEAQLLGQPQSPQQVVVDSSHVLQQTVAVRSGIPQRLLADAQGIAIVPGMVRGAFVVGLQHGRGVLLVRGGDGAWQLPRMIQITGGSIGYQIGVQSTDLVLVFRTEQSVANLLNRTIKIGVDASAAAGPVGRQASAATDLPMQAEILSYSRSRGAFVGVSIDGSSISVDRAADAALYTPPGTVPPAVKHLVEQVTALSEGGRVSQVAPPEPAAEGAIAAPQAPNDLEAARQRLDAVSRDLAAELPDDWKRYLALPAEIYMPDFVPSEQSIEQAIGRYEQVSRNPEYKPLTSRPEFEETLRGLWEVDKQLERADSKLKLPPPPATEPTR